MRGIEIAGIKFRPRWYDLLEASGTWVKASFLPMSRIKPIICVGFSTSLHIPFESLAFLLDEGVSLSKTIGGSLIKVLRFLSGIGIDGRRVYVSSGDVFRKVSRDRAREQQMPR